MANHLIDRIIIIDQDLFDNKTFVASVEENFNVSIDLLLDLESYDENAENVLYVSNTFSGVLFEKLINDKKHIISDVVVNHCIKERMALPLTKHPLFNYFMKEFVICFSINDKRKTNTINRYLNLIRFMGGQSRKDMKSGKSFDRTHLIESKTDSENYRFAVIYGIPIVYKEWIDFLWENNRNNDFISNDNEHILKYRLKPFVNLKISMLNFAQQEIEQLTQQIIDNDGTVVSVDDQNCTHLVIKNAKDFDYIDALENLINVPKYVVSESWFNSSINIQNREDEESHKLKIPMFNESCFNTPSKDDSLAHHTLNSILLSPNYDNSFDDSAIVDKSDLKKQAIAQELYQTEMNYVSILKDIIKVFRDPLKNHEMPEQFPNEIELKTIFGGLPPIIDVHEKILVELEKVVKDWKAENEIGKIFQKHSKDLLTVYPQYVNYYEKTKEMIESCTEKYPKFQSFLKACQTLPDCRKQTFKELLINPIQRLPRIEMYLRALLNKTDKLHPDFKLLNESLDTIVSVIKEINHEKKKTEGQIEMFDILNDIEDCPATLLSANRHFISKCDAKLLIQTPANDGVQCIHKLDNYLFCLLLFTDLILLCKKRLVKRTNSLRDRTSTLTSTVKKSKKSYKYIETIDISAIKYIYYDFFDFELVSDHENSFVLITHPKSGYRAFPAYPFVIKDLEMKKEKFIDDIVKTHESLSVEKDQAFVTKGYFKNVEFAHSKSIARSINKSKYVFMRTKERINRTFSARRSNANNLLSSISMENLNSNPSPATKRMSRVFTNFLTPKENDSFFNRNSRKIGSITNINELTNQDDAASGNFSLPTTPAPRKKKYQEPNS